MTAEVQAIEQLVTEWLYVETYGCIVGAFAPYEFETTVNPVGAPESSPTALRAELLSRAERALAALDGAGWQLTSYPVMEFRGEIIEAFRQTLAGDLVRPARQGLIELRMKFAVSRPR